MFHALAVLGPPQPISGHMAVGLIHGSTCTVTCRSHAQHGIFLGTEMLGTMPTIAHGHSFRFAGNIVSNGSSHPPPNGSVASVIGSVFPD